MGGCFITPRPGWVERTTVGGRVRDSVVARDDKVGVVLAEPMSVVRAGLRLLLTSDKNMRILIESGDAIESLAKIQRIRDPMPVVVLIGIEMRGQHDAFWLIRAVREASPSMIVIVTGTDLDTVAISRALFVGADGFINTNTDQDRLVSAVRRAASGEIVLEGLPRGALGGIVEGFSNGHGPVLTDREREVMIAAADGLTARQIARRLGIAERTITTHLNHIYRKLGARGRVSALSAAVRLGELDAGSGSRRGDDTIADIATIA
jgi:DNA-binding NarL/FixJ family response regulator